MNTLVVRACTLLFLASTTILRGQVPQLINYQGRVAVGTANFDGAGQFKFALVSSPASGAITTYWSNDGTSVAGSQPFGAVTLTVSKGLYSVLLGDTTLANMTAIPASVFSSADVRLRVWFDDGANGSQLLSPDQRIVAVGYALMAAGVNLPASTNLNEGVITQNDDSLLHTFGTQNFFAGSGAGNFTMTGVGQNTATGHQALSSNTTGNGDTASGYLALLSNTTGYYNTASGHRALLSNTTGSNNTASGVQVLSSNTQGSLNTASGFGALQSNTTGNSNIALGYAAGLSLTTGDNNIDIGNAGVAGESNIIRIGTFQSDTYLAGVIHGNGSALTGLTSSQFTGTMQLSGSAPVGGIISGTNSAIFGSGVVGVSTTGRGVIGTTSTAGASVAGVWGENSASGGTGIVGMASNTNSSGVAGVADASGSTGVYGRGAANGMYGTTTTGLGVYGESASGTGVKGVVASLGKGVWGVSPDGIGVFGESTSGTAVKGVASTSAGKGVWGINNSPGGQGLRGESTSGIGVFGTTTTGIAVLGIADGVDGQAGRFDGDVNIFGNGKLTTGIINASDVTVTGALSVQGSKNFKIDHPLDPANKYLVHSCVESPDVKNIYDGNIVTDAEGEATVTLPKYFEALNRDFRYQLTVMGQFAQAIVSSEIANNQFTIKTDKPNVKVSWLVTGIRQDAYMKAHPITVEPDKPEEERGTYQHPELFGLPEENSLFWKQNPTLAPQLKAERIQREAAPKASAK